MPCWREKDMALRPLPVRMMVEAGDGSDDVDCIHGYVCFLYGHPASAPRLSAYDDGKIRLKFQRPQRAVAAGQICALYDGGRLLGGGVFESVE